MPIVAASLTDDASCASDYLFYLSFESYFKEVIPFSCYTCYSLWPNFNTISSLS